MSLTYGAVSAFVISTSATLEKSVRISSIVSQDLFGQLWVMERGRARHDRCPWSSNRRVSGDGTEDKRRPLCKLLGTGSVCLFDLYVMTSAEREELLKIFSKDSTRRPQNFLHDDDLRCPSVVLLPSSDLECKV